MFYELRIYHPAPGRLGDLVERIGKRATVPSTWDARGQHPP